MPSGLVGGGGRMESLCSHKSCTDCLTQSCSLKGGVGAGGTRIRGFNAGDVAVGVGCGCGICYDLGPMIFLLMPALPCPFLGWTDGTVI